MSVINEVFQVVYSPAAQEDVRSIYNYIAYELLAEQGCEKASQTHQRNCS